MNEFEYDKDTDVNVDTDLEFDTNVTLDKDADINVDVDSNVDLDGNTSSATFTAEAIGNDTIAEADLNVLSVEGELSSVDGALVAVADANDPPIVTDDMFFVEFGDTALVDVLGNDFDPDSTIDPTTLTFMGASLGTATNVGGQLQYAADPIVYDTTDSSEADEFTYTVADTEGAVSDPANVTAKVIDPLRETDTDSAAAANGQDITLQLSTEERTFNDSSFAEVDIVVGGLDPQEFNVVFIVDGSGSLDSAEYATELSAVQQTIDSLEADFAGSSDNIEVKLIQFSGFSNPAIRETAEFNLTDAALNDIAALPELANQIAGGTNYEPPLQAALNYFNSEPGSEQNFVFFASDGNPNVNNFADDATALQAVADVQAFGFGNNINSGPLDTVDSDNAVILPNASDLANAFAASPLFPADLLDFSLTVDGTEVADETDLNPLGGGDFDLATTLTGLDNDLGDTNTVVATASFDIDNDGIADEVRTAQTIIDGTDGSDIMFA